MIHYNDVIMGAKASQIASLTIVYSTVYLGADQRKHESSASLTFVRGIHRWPVKFPHKWSVTRKMLPFHEVIMYLPALSQTMADCFTYITKALHYWLFVRKKNTCDRRISLRRANTVGSISMSYHGFWLWFFVFCRMSYPKIMHLISISLRILLMIIINKRDVKRQITLVCLDQFIRRGLWLWSNRDSEAVYRCISMCRE